MVRQDRLLTREFTFINMYGNEPKGSFILNGKAHS
jgi:hypothetical protein